MSELKLEGVHKAYGRVQALAGLSFGVAEGRFFALYPHLLVALASASDLRLAPHLWAGAPAFAAGLHLAAASPCAHILEYSLGANPMIHDMIEERFEIHDGSLEIPTRPGLGITVREDFVEQFRKAV